MLSFSQRKDLKPIKKLIQIDSIDDELRTDLWNAIHTYYWDLARKHNIKYTERSIDLFPLICNLFVGYFHRPIDTIPIMWDGTYREIKKYFFSCEWNEVYDFVEFIANNYSDKIKNEYFIRLCNTILERQSSGYRFINGIITEITSETEISEIEEALHSTQTLTPVNTHLKDALRFLADRTSPNYRNSIKESISAVESICSLIASSDKAELGEALKKIKDEGIVKIHPALESAFHKLYGYTSNADGIRHAMLEESSAEFEDAKFMLVSCSAFINYLLLKSEKAGIKI